MDFKLQFYTKFLPLVLRVLSNKKKISLLRKIGVKIGEGTLINACHFSTEPYLIEIGNHCAIASGTRFFTHDGGVWCLQDDMPNIDKFGKIKIGNNVFLGANSIVLPKTIVGDNCVIGAGSVLRGKFESNSIIMGNPAKKTLSIGAYKTLVKMDNDIMETQHLSMKEKEILVKKKFI